MDRAYLRRMMIGTMISGACAFMIGTIAISSYAENIKKRNGLNFHVPEDWPIEKRGGILAPIPTEEYISIKFKATEEEFQAIKVDLTSKFEELQLDIKNMEINFTKEVQKVQAQADSQPGSGEDLTSLLARINLLESEAKRLDLKITTKVAVMKIKAEEALKLTKSFEEKIEALKYHIKILEEEIDYVSEKQENAY